MTDQEPPAVDASSHPRERQESPAGAAPLVAEGDREPAPPVLATPLAADPATGDLDYFQLLRTAAEPEVPAPAG